MSKTIETLATLQMPDPYDDRDGVWFSRNDVNRIKKLGAGAKIYGPEAMERIKKLESEVVELRKDAERYRWLRDIGQDVVDVFFVTDKNASGWGAWDSHDDKDAAIDAAMQRENP